MTETQTLLVGDAADVLRFVRGALAARGDEGEGWTPQELNGLQVCLGEAEGLVREAIAEAPAPRRQDEQAEEVPALVADLRLRGVDVTAAAAAIRAYVAEAGERASADGYMLRQGVRR